MFSKLFLVAALISLSHAACFTNFGTPGCTQLANTKLVNFCSPNCDNTGKCWANYGEELTIEFDMQFTNAVTVGKVDMTVTRNSFPGIPIEIIKDGDLCGTSEPPLCGGRCPCNLAADTTHKYTKAMTITSIYPSGVYKIEALIRLFNAQNVNDDNLCAILPTFTLGNPFEGEN